MPILRSWARTDVGHKRKHNEDSFLVDEGLFLYVVADGMGGHAAGEVASAQAVRSIQAAFAGHKPVLESFARDPTVESREQVAGLM
jgi:serine/threonine protein phosphatase PrpC